MRWRRAVQAEGLRGMKPPLSLIKSLLIISGFPISVNFPPLRWAQHEHCCSGRRRHCWPSTAFTSMVILPGWWLARCDGQTPSRFANTLLSSHTRHGIPHRPMPMRSRFQPAYARCPPSQARAMPCAPATTIDNALVSAGSPETERTGTRERVNGKKQRRLHTAHKLRGVDRLWPIAQASQHAPWHLARPPVEPFFGVFFGGHRDLCTHRGDVRGREGTRERKRAGKRGCGASERPNRPRTVISKVLPHIPPSATAAIPVDGGDGLVLLFPS